MAMKVQFWGVRGSIASFNPQQSRVGGNTACVEVQSQGVRLILDAGTGIRALGDQMAQEPHPRATLLFSHLHWDHVQGFPFFRPAYLPSAELTLIGPEPLGARGLRATLERQMSPPNFPVPLGAMRAKLAFEAARPGQAIELGPFRVTPFALPHPQDCLGYRIEADGAVFVFATDVELSAAGLTPEISRAIERADLLALDAQYTPEEYAGHSGPSKKGWGHSTMMDAAQVASALNVRRLLLFHHDPSRDDAQVDAMVAEAQRVFPATEAAREGEAVELDNLTLRCA
jgi:phosphoribosyl 1,2-cyclic phosphodiesterase